MVAYVIGDQKWVKHIPKASVQFEAMQKNVPLKST